MKPRVPLAVVGYCKQFGTDGVLWIGMGTDDPRGTSGAKSQQLKERLLERAKYGEITGEQADAEAMRLGLGSLSREPGDGEFRPEAEANWTLPMAVAWITYRDLEVVREWSAPFRENCLDWRWQRWRAGTDGHIHEGWYLEQRSKPTLPQLVLSAVCDQEADGKQPAMPFHEDRKALWTTLQRGHL